MANDLYENWINYNSYECYSISILINNYLKQILHFSNHWLLFQRSMLRVHQAAWRMQMYNGCPATNFLPLPSFLKSAYEIKWNRSGNCLLLFQALISRRRYRETFLQKERERERVARETLAGTRRTTFFTS